MLECGLTWVVLLIAAFKASEKLSLKQVSFAQISGAGTVYLKFWSPCLLPTSWLMTGEEDKTDF